MTATKTITTTITLTLTEDEAVRLSFLLGWAKAKLNPSVHDRAHTLATEIRAAIWTAISSK